MLNVLSPPATWWLQREQWRARHKWLKPSLIPEKFLAMKAKGAQMFADQVVELRRGKWWFDLARINNDAEDLNRHEKDNSNGWLFTSLHQLPGGDFDAGAEFAGATQAVRVARSRLPQHRSTAFHRDTFPTGNDNLEPTASWESHDKSLFGAKAGPDAAHAVEKSDA